MNWKSEKGVTGADIILAIILITIFISIIAVLSYRIQKNTDEINRKTEATSYAVDVIENIKNIDYASLPIAGNNKIEGIAQLADGYLTDSSGNATGYYQTIIVEDYIDFEGNEDKEAEILKKITVEISYKVGKDTETITLSTTRQKGD